MSIYFNSEMNPIKKNRTSLQEKEKNRKGNQLRQYMNLKPEQIDVRQVLHKIDSCPFIINCKLEIRDDRGNLLEF